MITLHLHTPHRLVPPVWTRHPLVAEIPDPAYVQASERLRLNTIPLLLAQLEQVLREETLGIYDYEKVAAYLDEQCRQLTEQRRANGWRSWHHEYHWHWHPIQEYQLPLLASVTWLPSQHRDAYNKPIPAEILPTIDRIQKRVPEALFYASDIQDFRDPFLAVTVHRADKLYVIERWDESGFRS